MVEDEINEYGIHRNTGRIENMRICKYIIVIVLAVVLSGCYPARDIMRYGLRGRVIDAAGQPVSSAELVFVNNIANNSEEIGKAGTDINGRFCISPKYDIYITWVICGPILHSLPPASVTIRAADYRTMMYRIVLAGDSLPEAKVETLYVGKPQRGYIDFGDIGILKR